MTYFAFRESIDLWTWLGALIIFASAVYITRREAKLARERAQLRAQQPASELGGT
jgi:drug/metabolite transporter (DMT)-like permease